MIDPSYVAPTLRLPIRFSSALLAELERQAAPSPGVKLVEAEMATACLKAAAGDFDAAEVAVLTWLRERPDPARDQNGDFFPILMALFVMQRFDLAGDLLRRRFNLGCSIELRISESGPGTVRVLWEVMLPERMVFTFGPAVLSGTDTKVQLLLFFWLFPLFATYAEQWPGENGAVIVNLGDAGYSPGLSLCDNHPERFLIPDTSFIATRGYELMRHHFTKNDVKWSERQAIALWRGGTTGHPFDRRDGWRSLPRVKLCNIANLNSKLIDAGISKITFAEQTTRDEIQAAGLLRPYVPSSEFNRYKYQIDIDGNTNAWSGLFQKLLTGSPVLKVASPSGYRQWYYNRLKPWISFVPVAADMSDLVEKINWLQAHDDTAQVIGERGRSVALSLDYEGELRRAIPTIAAGLRYSSGRPETELHFRSGGNGQAFVREGWLAAMEDGMPARDQESSIELPRPITAQDHVLSIDVSPAGHAQFTPAQRIAVAANGEILNQAVLTHRRTLHCRLPQHAIDAADILMITLLHPDSVGAASAECPLDERVLSVILHAITLTPVGVWRRSGEVMSAVLPPPRKSQQDDRGTHLYGPDIWLPAEVALLPVATSHDTILFADDLSCELRHGSSATSPHNVLLATSGARAYLLHIATDGERYTIRIAPEAGAQEKTEDGTVPGTPLQGFRIVRTLQGASTAFGLSSHGLFLCAEGDGRVTLSRRQLAVWERFRLIKSDN